jgi:hypothetical protein
LARSRLCTAHALASPALTLPPPTVLFSKRLSLTVVLERVTADPLAVACRVCGSPHLPVSQSRTGSVAVPTSARPTATELGFLALSVRFSPVISPTSDFCVPKSVQPTWTLLGLLRFQLNRAPRACCPFPPWKRLITLMLRAVHRCLKVTFMPGMYPAPSYLHLLRCHALPPPLKPCLVPLPRPLHTTH